MVAERVAVVGTDSQTGSVGRMSFLLNVEMMSAGGNFAVGGTLVFHHSP